MIQSGLLFALLCASTVAHAEVTDPVAPDWARVDDRMHSVFKVGTTALWGGLIGSIVGNISGQPIISVASQMATTGGTVARTASSLRQRTSIIQRGVDVSGAWGYASWGLLGTGVALGAAGTAYASGLEFDENGSPPPEAVGPLIGFSLGSLGANIGGLVAAGKQMQVNSRQRRMLGQSRVHDPKTFATFRWTPLVHANGEPGIALMGLF